MGKNQIHKQAEAQVHGGCNNIQKIVWREHGMAFWHILLNYQKALMKPFADAGLGNIVELSGASEGLTIFFFRLSTYTYSSWTNITENQTTTKKYTALVWYYDNDLLSQELRENDKIHGQKDRNLEL